MRINSKLEKLDSLCIPEIRYGDIRLNVYPIFGHDVVLPGIFSMYEKTLTDILSHVPYQKRATTHYVTIQSKFFSRDGFLRREGVHIDGNFCVDRRFPYKTWSGVSIDSDGEIVKDWVSPYPIDIEEGDYVSSDKGGILTVSSSPGCRVWPWECDVDVDIRDGGHILDGEFMFDRTNSVDLLPNNLYFMTSNTPHETLPVKAGVRRTFIRITLDHNYENQAIFDRVGVAG